MSLQAQPNSYIQQLQSPDPVEVYGALRSIKNSIIGSTTMKTMYCQLSLIPNVATLLIMDDTDVQIRIQATTIISSLAHKGKGPAIALHEHGVMAPLINQIAPGIDPMLVEASERALNALLSHKSIKVGIEGHINMLVSYLLSIITENKGSDQVYEMRTHARIELAVLILGKLCVAEARQYTIANTGAISMLIPLLLCKYPRLQIATLDTLTALSYENMEICNALSTVSHDDTTFVNIVLGMVRHTDPEIRLNSCQCLANLSRMRVSGSSLKDIQTVVVPALVKLIKVPEVDTLHVIRTLGYLCHEDGDIQAAAKNSGAVTELMHILAKVDQQEKEDFVDHSHNVLLAKAVFLTLGTIVSTIEDCRRKAVESQVFTHLVRAMSHKDSGIRSAACLCTRYIVRSVSICRTHVPESGLLKPLLKLLQDGSVDVQITASATTVNLLTDFSPLRADALKEGLVDILVKLLGSDDISVRRNALWSIRNLMVRIDDTMRKEIVDKVGLERLYTLTQPDTPSMIREHAVGALRNMVADSMWGIDALFDSLGSSRITETIRRLLQSGNESAIHIHTLYLINNISVRSQQHCELFAKDEETLKAIVDHVGSSVSEVAVAALWCINSIASHRAYTSSESQVELDDEDEDMEDDISTNPRTCRYMDELKSVGIHDILKSMLEDNNLSLEVLDRVRSCLDYFQSVDS